MNINNFFVKVTEEMYLKETLPEREPWFSDPSQLLLRLLEV